MLMTIMTSCVKYTSVDGTTRDANLSWIGAIIGIFFGSKIVSILNGEKESSAGFMKVRVSQEREIGCLKTIIVFLVCGFLGWAIWSLVALIV
jgi:hypothetical protein